MTSFYLYNIICFTKKTSFWFKINFKEFHPLLIEIWASIFRVGVLPHVTLPRHYSAVTWTPWRLEIKGHSIGCSTVCTGNIRIKNSTTSQHLCEGNPPPPPLISSPHQRCVVQKVFHCHNIIMCLLGRRAREGQPSGRMCRIGGISKMAARSMAVSS